MRLTIIGALALVGALATTATVQGHHGWGYYDTARPLYLAGHIAAVDWRNPHPTVTVDDIGPPRPIDGSSLPVPAELKALGFDDVLARARPADRNRPWILALAPINRQQSWGLSREPRVGDPIVAIAFPACNEPGTARAVLIVLDGIGVRQQSVALPRGCSGSPRG